MSCRSLQYDAGGLKVSFKENADSVVHPVASARDLRCIDRLGAMNEAQMVSPGGVETPEINTREGVTLLARVQTGKEDSLLLVERDRLRRGIFNVVLRGVEPAVFYGNLEPEEGATSIQNGINAS